jgi:hypothetical protein
MPTAPCPGCGTGSDAGYTGSRDLAPTVAELAAALHDAGVTGRDPTDLAAELRRRIRERRTRDGGSPVLPPLPPGAGYVRLAAVINAARLDGPGLPWPRLAAAARDLLPDHEVLQIGSINGTAAYEFTCRLAADILDAG